MANRDRTYEVRIDDDLLADDLRGASDAARTGAELACAHLAEFGVEAEGFLRCDDCEGAALAGMFKLRVPIDDPVGPWGIVLEPVRLPAERIGFAYVASGARHLPAESSAWSVYLRAHYRLVGPGERTMRAT